MHWFLAIICNPEHTLRQPVKKKPPPQTRRKRKSLADESVSDDDASLKLEYPPQVEEAMDIDALEFNRKLSLQDVKIRDVVSRELQYPEGASHDENIKGKGIELPEPPAVSRDPSSVVEDDSLM